MMNDVPIHYVLGFNSNCKKCHGCAKVSREGLQDKMPLGKNLNGTCLVPQVLVAIAINCDQLTNLVNLHVTEQEVYWHCRTYSRGEMLKHELHATLAVLTYQT